MQAQAKERSILDQQAAPIAASIRHPATSASSTAAAYAPAAPAAPATDLGHAQGPKFIALQTLHGTQATGPATSAGTVPQLVLLPIGNIGVVQLPAPSMQNTHPGASGMPQLMYAGGPNGGMHGGMYPYMHPGMGYPPPPPGYMYAPTGFVPQQHGFGAETMTPSYTGTGSYTTTHGTHSTMPSTMSISPHHAHAHGYQYGMWHAGNPAMQHQQQHVRPSAARHAAGQEHDTSQQLHAQRQLYPMQAPNLPPQSAFPVASYQPHAQHNELASRSGQRASDPWVTYTDPRAIHSDPQATPTASHANAPSVQAHPDLVASLRDMLAVVGQQTLGSVDGGYLQEAAGVGVCVTGAGAGQQGGMAGYTSNGTVTGAAGQQQLILQHRNQSQQHSQQQQQQQGGTVPAQAHTCAPSVQQGAVPLTRSPSASSSVSLAGPARSASGTGTAANGDGIKGNMLQAQAPAARRLPVSEAVESPGSARASDSTPSIHSLASQLGDTHGISAEHRTSAHSMASISVASMDSCSVDAAMTPRAYRSASARYDLVTATAQAAAGLRSVVEEQPDEVQVGLVLRRAVADIVLHGILA